MMKTHTLFNQHRNSIKPGQDNLNNNHQTYFEKSEDISRTPMISKKILKSSQEKFIPVEITARNIESEDIEVDEIQASPSQEVLKIAEKAGQDSINKQ